MVLATPRTSSPQEHDALQRAAEGFRQAHDGAMQMASLRPDQRDLWEKVAAMAKIAEGQLFDLASQGMFSREGGEYGGGKLS